MRLARAHLTWWKVQRVALAIASLIFTAAGVFLVIAEHSAMAWFCALFFTAVSLVLVMDLVPNNPLERRRKARTLARYPKVSVDEDAIAIDDRKGSVATIPWSELERIAVLTTSDGPYTCDFFWVLESNAVVHMFASESEGADAAVTALTALPGFDYGAMLLAAGSVTDNIFPVWRRRDELSAG